MNSFTGLSSRRRTKLVKRRTNHTTPSPLLLPPYADNPSEIRYASVTLRSPCPISPVRPKFTASLASTTLATHALYAAITQKEEGTDVDVHEQVTHLPSPRNLM
jgi:hypothetical protein